MYRERRVLLLLDGGELKRKARFLCGQGFQTFGFHDAREAQEALMTDLRLNVAIVDPRMLPHDAGIELFTILRRRGGKIIFLMVYTLRDASLLHGITWKQVHPDEPWDLALKLSDLF